MILRVTFSLIAIIVSFLPNNLYAAKVLPVQEGKITKYLINVNYKRPYAEVTGSLELYLQNSDTEGKFNSIIKNLQFNKHLGRKATVNDDPTRFFANRLADRRFFLSFDDEGKIGVEFKGDYNDDYQTAMAPYWALLSYDTKLIEELKANKTEYERVVRLELDSRPRNCRAQFKVIEEEYSYNTEMNVNFENCVPTEGVAIRTNTGTNSYHVHITQSLNKEDFSLKWRTVDFQTFKTNKKLETSGSIIINFEGYLDAEANKTIFQPKPTTLDGNIVKLSEVFPFKPEFDTRYSVTAFIKDFSNRLNLEFELYVRNVPGNDYYAFGRIVNVKFPTHYSSKLLRDRFKEAFERHFVFGFNENGQILYKYLDEGGKDQNIGHRTLYGEVLRYDRESVTKACPSINHPFESDFQVKSIYVGEGCKTSHELHDKDPYFETVLTLDTAETCGRGSRGKFWGLIGKQKPAEDGLYLEIKQSLFKQDLTLQKYSAEFEWASVISRETHIQAKVEVTFDDYLVKDDDLFRVYDQVVQDETYFA